MASVRVQEAASHRLDAIYRYTRDRWGAEQADRYITGLFAAFDRIKTHEVMSRPVPVEFGVEGAERFHAGGMPGLRPDEASFVGLRSEEVLTGNDPRHRWNAERLDRMRMPSPANDVQVNVYDMRIGRDQPPARTEQRRGADGKREIAVFIEDKIDEAIRSGRLDRAQSREIRRHRVKPMARAV